MRNLLSCVLSVLCVSLLACAAPEAGRELGPADAGNPQASYEYPGCPNEDYGCPRLKTVSCALEAIRQKHDTACTQVTDCAQVSLDNDCTGVSSCGGVYISAAGAAAFQTEAQAEVNRYCGPAPECRSSGSCVATVPACVNGRCVGVAPDAGS